VFGPCELVFDGEAYLPGMAPGTEIRLVKDSYTIPSVSLELIHCLLVRLLFPLILPRHSLCPLSAPLNPFFVLSRAPESFFTLTSLLSNGFGTSVGMGSQMNFRLFGDCSIEVPTGEELQKISKYLPLLKAFEETLKTRMCFYSSTAFSR